MKRILLLLSMFLFIASVEAWIPRAPARSQLEYNYVPPTSYVSCDTQPCEAPCNSTCYNPPCWDWLGLNGVYGQFLWWNVYGDQLDWARQTVTTTVNAAPVQNSDTVSAVYTHKFDFAPGFRLGFNHIFPCTENDLSLAWTYYWNSNSASQESLASPGTIANRLTSPYLNTVTAALFAASVDQAIESSMNFRLNRVDLTFGQNVQACNCVTLNYFGGAVFWQTRENLNVASDYVITQFGSLVQEVNIETDYRGAGAQVGGRLNWNILNSLVFSANAALAGTVGDYTQNNSFDSVFTTPLGVVVPSFSTFNSNLDNSLSYWTTRVAASVGLSLRYSLCFWNQWLAYADIGWEYHHYFNQTAFQVLPLGSIGGDTSQAFTRSPADLAVHGLTLTFGVTF